MEYRDMAMRRTARLLLAALLALAALPAGALLAGRGGADARPASSALSGAAAEGKLIALTFDDGPRRATTTKLLDGLAERGVKATFFLIGAQIENNEDVIQRMDREGHQIGIHTFDHVQLTGLNRADFSAQVDKTRERLTQVLGHGGFLLRPPYGLLDESVKEWAGCPILLWSIDPKDWDDQNAQREIQYVTANARDGGIILMHDIFYPSVDAALAIVDQLHAQGYFFCTIDQLFAARGIPLEAGESYWNAYP